METGKKMNKEERRRQILDAAMVVFTEKGYSSSTTTEISKAAGISEVTLFRYFSSKQEIFLEGIRPILFGTLEKTIDISNNYSPVEKLEYILTERISFISQHYEIVRLILKEAPLLKELGNESFIETILKLIKNMLSKIGIMLNNEEFVLRLLMGSILSFLYMPDNNEISIKNYISKVTSMLLNEMKE